MRNFTNYMFHNLDFAPITIEVEGHMYFDAIPGIKLSIHMFANWRFKLTSILGKYINFLTKYKLSNFLTGYESTDLLNMALE